MAIPFASDKFLDELILLAQPDWVL